MHISILVSHCSQVFEMVSMSEVLYPEYCYEFLISSIHAACPSHYLLSDLTITSDGGRYNSLLEHTNKIRGLSPGHGKAYK
jgi:hypothetical protein